MTFYKSKDGAVTVTLTQILNGAEIFIFDKKINGTFQINGKELYKDETIFFPRTTRKEAHNWLLEVGFKESIDD